MKKFFVIAAVTLFVVACNNNNDKASSPADPNMIHSEAEAVPDSLKIVNDSTVVPDAKPGNPTNGTK